VDLNGIEAPGAIFVDLFRSWNLPKETSSKRPAAKNAEPTATIGCRDLVMTASPKPPLFSRRAIAGFLASISFLLAFGFSRRAEAPDGFVQNRPLDPQRTDLRRKAG